MFVMLIVFIAMSVYLANYKPHSAYFLLPARAFELMIGAMLAVSYAKIPTFNKYISHALSIIGLTLIMVPAFVIDKHSVFPGFNALWPCLGAALLIATGKDQNNMGIINRLISTRRFVFIGLISYSLYLWHWPVFVFIQYLGLELQGVLQISAIIASFVLAYLSWRFVEQPVRHMNLPTLKSAMKKIMLPSFIVLTILYGVIDVKNGFPERFDNLAEFDKKQNFPSTVRKKCHDKDFIGNIEQCWIGVEKEKTKDNLDGMLIGDSFGNHSASFIDVLAKDAGLFFHDSTSGGHPVLTRLLAPNKFEYDPKYALDRLEYALQFEHIILGVNWDNPLYATPNQLNHGALLDAIERIVNAGKKVTVILSLPATNPVHLHKMKLAKGSDFVFFDDLDYSVRQPPRGSSHIITIMKSRFPSISFIDLQDVMCEKGHCDLILNDTILYRNSNHFNTSGAAMVAQKYLAEKGNLLKTVQASQ